MQTQYTVLNYRIDLYFHKYKLAIEIDELGHNDRNIDYEIQRQRALERKLNRVFIRINPDAVEFNIFREINKIHRHIKKSSKKSWIDKISKRLLELKFVENRLIKSKCLKQIVKITSYIIKACISIVNNVIKNIQVTRFQKKKILISKNKIKERSKCNICLTKRTFIEGIEGDLEIGL